MAHRVIVTKRKVYELADDAVGIPVVEYFPKITLPEPLRRGKIYETSDGPVLAMPEPEPPRQHPLAPSKPSSHDL